MTQVFLGLGSNLERKKNIQSGIDALQKVFGLLIISPVYESESVGFKGRHFYNLVVGIDTEFALAELSETLKKIEDDNGRVRTGPKYSPRTLDIDILTYGNFVGVEAGVIIPRDEITKNAFVLLPLSKIAPNELHPGLKKTYAELWSEYDKSTQHLWQVEFDLTSAVAESDLS
ncbi:MAG: 2-amino-4-hydroxy-6-hydroxymethyldihydropteridine diphosphokinase [Cellvibrio sp.]